MKPQLYGEKGTIVCDTSAMLSLMAALPIETLTKEGYRKDPLPTVFDGLIFLARHGYEVVIPEIVACELGNHMRDGENIDRYFTHNKATQFDKALTHRTFFREIARLEKQGDSVRIQPPLPHDTSSEAQFLNQTYHVHCLPIPDSKKRAELLRLGSLPTGEEAGKNQIRSYIKHLPSSNTPIYILSNNLSLLHSFANRKDVNGLGVTAFYNALKHEGFLSPIGINPDALNFDQHCHDYYAQYDIDVNHAASSYTDSKSGDRLNFQTNPFAAAMKRLAQEIREQEAKDAPSPEATVDITDSDYQGPAKPLSAVEKFNQRFGGRK